MEAYDMIMPVCMCVCVSVFIRLSVPYSKFRNKRRMFIKIIIIVALETAPPSYQR